MKLSPVFVFLYEELAGYFLACITTLNSKYNVNVHVIHRKINSDAPFSFQFPEGVHFYSQEDFSSEQLLELIVKINPDAVYCGGWRNKKYLHCARKMRELSVPVILGFDNKWKGTPKQILLSLTAPVFFRKYFSHAFVAGESQKKFARKLGFPLRKISTGVYSADTNMFHSVWKNSDSVKKENFPKRFIYTGRYSPEKGLENLWNAFVRAVKNVNEPWELWCVGTGPLEKKVHPLIKHLGFVQPTDLPGVMKQTGVFVMPSLFEPWGVVLHEFTCAGFPVICSSEVGASELFLEVGLNGYSFHSGDEKELENLLVKIMNLSEQELLKMSGESARIGLGHNLDSWSQNFLSLVSGNKTS